MKKEGKIDPNTGAMWVRNTLHQRFELRCTYKMTDEIGASKQCLYRKRPDRYNEHPHFFSLKKDVQHKITEMYMPFKVTPIVAKAAALLNISANAASSAPFKEMIQELAIYGYECAKNNKNINIHDYSDKDVNSSIIQLANKRREEKLKIFQEYGYCSLILDAGTVRSFHTVEIMLMLPGLTKPLLYSTHSLEKGNIPEYKQLVLNQILELANLGIILTGICGDNLPAQKNALDHKYNNSLQDEANHIGQNRLLEQSLMNGINKDDEIHNNSITKNTITDQINKVKNNIENNTICLLYNPCLNHVIHLAFNDSQEFDESLQTCVKVLYLYKEFFNEDVVKANISFRFKFKICKTRWQWLFSGLMYIMENQKSINQIYTFKNKKHEEPFQELLAKENYELIEKKVPDIILKVINITWPLHTFTFFIENEQTNISTVLPIYDLVIDRIQVQGEKYELPNLASILIQFLNKRFKETGRFELLQISYLLSPIGRNSLKKNPDPVENAINMDFYELPIGSSEEKVKQLIKKYHIETSNDYIYHENETYELSNIQLDLSEIAEIQKTIAESIADIIDIGKEIVVFFQEIVIMTEELIDNDVNDIAEQIDNFFHASYDFFIQYQTSFESFEYLKENKLMTLPKKSWVSVLNKTLDYLEKEKVISDLIIISELFEIHYENQMEEIDLISDDILLSISMYKLKKSSSSLWDGFETVQMLGAEQVTIFGVAQMAKNLQYNENEMNALLEAWFSEYEVTRNSSNAIQISVIHKIKEKLHPILYWISIKKLLPNWEQFADIAIRFLSLPVSESGCERVFSLRRRIISHLHTRISTKQQYARTFIINDSRQ